MPFFSLSILNITYIHMIIWSSPHLFFIFLFFISICTWQMPRNINQQNLPITLFIRGKSWSDLRKLFSLIKYLAWGNRTWVYFLLRILSRERVTFNLYSRAKISHWVFLFFYIRHGIETAFVLKDLMKYGCDIDVVTKLGSKFRKKCLLGKFL